MTMIRIYLRVLALLAPHARMAWTLALCNLALACTLFAEPVLGAFCFLSPPVKRPRIAPRGDSTQAAYPHTRWARNPGKLQFAIANASQQRP